MTDSSVLAVTLVSSTDFSTSARIAGLLSGAPADGPSQEYDSPEGDSADLAVDLADGLSAAVRGGAAGDTVIALDPDAEASEVALVLEHVLDSDHRTARITVRDVVAVTSVHEVMSVLFGQTETGDPAGDVDAPGRLARRLEFASIVVVTDVSSSGAPEGTRYVTDLLAALAPAARIVDEAKLPLVWSRSRSSARGRAHLLGASMGWQQRLSGRSREVRADSTTAVHVFQDPRPFHPVRLLAAVTTELVPARVGRILRSRGFTQLATRSGVVGSWATAGDVLDLDPTDMSTGDIGAPAGQDIAFFGLDLDPRALDDALAACLLTPAELSAGPMVWASYADPFPTWPLPHTH